MKPDIIEYYILQLVITREYNYVLQLIILCNYNWQYIN